MAEIARPDLLQEADRDAHLAAQRHLPQQHAAQQRPPAIAARPVPSRAAMKLAVKPQMHICSTGQ